MLRAWAGARNGDHAAAQALLDQAQMLENYQIDPQLPSIFTEIRARLSGKTIDPVFFMDTLVLPEKF